MNDTHYGTICIQYLRILSHKLNIFNGLIKTLNIQTMSVNTPADNASDATQGSVVFNI